MRSGLRWLWVAIIVFGLDRVSKYLAVHFLTYYQPHHVAPSFNLTLSYNTGAAFSFLDKATGWQMWLFGSLALGMSVAITIWLSRLSYRQRWLSIALSMIVGGALGNLYDRIVYGRVVDFLQFYVSHLYWPVFNIADSAICIGAVMLFWDAMFKDWCKKKCA